MSRDGWQADPFGTYEERLFKDGEPTPLVRDHGVGSYDEPPDSVPSFAAQYAQPGTQSDAAESSTTINSHQDEAPGDIGAIGPLERPALDSWQVASDEAHKAFTERYKAVAASDVSQGPGWWLASDGKWYSPEQHPNYVPPPPPPASSLSATGIRRGPLPTAYSGPRSTNGLCVASLVLGLVPVVPFVGSILAIVFGSIGKRQVHESNGRQGGRLMAIWGMVLGWLGLLGSILVVVLVVVAFNHARNLENPGNSGNTGVGGSLGSTGSLGTTGNTGSSGTLGSTGNTGSSGNSQSASVATLPPVAAAQPSATTPVTSPPCPAAPSATITSVALTPEGSGDVEFWSGTIQGTVRNPGPALGSAAANISITFTPPAGDSETSPQSLPGTTADGTVPAQGTGTFSLPVDFESVSAPTASITSVSWAYADPSLINCAHLVP